MARRAAARILSASATLVPPNFLDQERRGLSSALLVARRLGGSEGRTHARVVDESKRSRLQKRGHQLKAPSPTTARLQRVPRLHRRDGRRLSPSPSPIAQATQSRSMRRSPQQRGVIEGEIKIRQSRNLQGGPARSGPTIVADRCVQGLDLGVGTAPRGSPHRGLPRARRPGRGPSRPRSRSALGGVIGIEVARSRRDIDPVHRPGTPTPRTRSTAERIAPFKPWRSANFRQGGRSPLPPEPRSHWPVICPHARRAWFTGWSRTGSGPSRISSLSKLGLVPRGVVAAGWSGLIVGGVVRKSCRPNTGRRRRRPRTISRLR